ncbi:MAG: LysR family transcriptional regulator [Solirubrobacteraceae bacterium]
MVPIRQLEALVAVADTEHFGNAGRRLGTTTTAVSGLIARLERTVGMDLVRRTSRRVCLTAKGVALLDEARAVLEASRRLLRRVAEVDEGRGGAIRVGVTPSCRRAGAATVQALREASTRWRVITSEHHPGTLGDHLDEGRVELAVTDRPGARVPRPWWCKPWERVRPRRYVIPLTTEPGAAMLVRTRALSAITAATHHGRLVHDVRSVLAGQAPP